MEGLDRPELVLLEVVAVAAAVRREVFLLLVSSVCMVGNTELTVLRQLAVLVVEVVAVLDPEILLPVYKQPLTILVVTAATERQELAKGSVLPIRRELQVPLLQVGVEVGVLVPRVLILIFLVVMALLMMI